jgi:cytochrome-b5 reductase
MRLQNSGLDLSGTNGRVTKITYDELKKHKTEQEVWIGLRGKVFNVTEYLDFHPGGREELMKGAGKDATSLFGKLHFSLFSYVQIKNIPGLTMKLCWQNAL